MKELNKIMDYLYLNEFNDAVYTNAPFGVDRIEFNIHDCKVSVNINDISTLEQFIEKTNNRYLEHLENSERLHSSAAKHFKSMIDDFTSVMPEIDKEE